MEPFNLHLPNFPTELVESIARELPLQSHRNFRLTCRSLLSKSSRPFNRYFRERSISITSEIQLFNLLCVANDEQFGPLLTNLIVDGTPRIQKEVIDARKRPTLTSDFQAGKAKHYALEYQRRRYRNFVLQSVSQPTNSISNLEGLYANSKVETKIIYGPAYFMLVKAFESLPNPLRTITFKYEAFHELDKSENAGMGGIRSGFAMQDNMRAEEEMSRPFVWTMSALAASSLGVSEIRIQNDKRHGFVSVERLRFNANQYSLFRDVFSGVRVLTLDIRGGAPVPHTIFPPVYPWVARFLQRFPNVEELDLSCHVYASRREDVFKPISEYVQMGRLKKCTLALITGEEDSFERFLSHSKDSLQQLTLRNMIIARQGTWSSLLKTIAQSLTALETLDLDNLYEKESFVLFSKREGAGNHSTKEYTTRFKGEALRKDPLFSELHLELTAPDVNFGYFWDDAVRLGEQYGGLWRT